MSDLEDQMQGLLAQQQALEQRLGIDSSGQDTRSKKMVIDSGDALVTSLRTADTLLQQQQLSLLQHQEKELQRIAASKNALGSSPPPPPPQQAVLQYASVPNPPPRKKQNGTLPTNPYMIL